MARFCLLWLIPFVLHAGPALRVLEVGSSHFPNVEILVELGEGEGTPQFTLRDGAPITPSIGTRLSSNPRPARRAMYPAAGSATASSAEGSNNSGGGLVGLLVRAAIRQIIEAVSDQGHTIAAQTSVRLLSAGRPNGILYGPRSPMYQKDGTPPGR